ncbi:MAG: Rad52/Rad22 family DNA repair protein [Pseudomonadota bacterium]
MSFSDTQIRKLQRDVRPCDVRTREVHGRELSYIEGWHAIAEANRIFGFDGWSRETVEYRCLVSREKNGIFQALYVAKIRITVRTETANIVREGFGTGEAQAATAGEAHDKAIKTAETDATKRAFATFGKPFGLSLYLGSRKRTEPKPDIQRSRTLQRLSANGRYYPVPRPRQSLLDADTPTVQRNGPKSPSAETAPPCNDQDRPHRGEQTASSSVKLADVTLPPGDPATTPDFTDPPHGIAVKTSPDLVDTGAVDALLLIDRPRRRRNPEHLKYVSSQPCLICSRTPSDAHHLKFAQPKALSKKVSDEFTVPLCRIHHRQLHHAGNEVNWWMDMEVDPLPIAQDLWSESQARAAEADDK